ncbi:hypothetical protein [Flammeovirga sp. OC4]|nr:hypothetical protein [Flammeovirga sp. OC4]
MATELKEQLQKNKHLADEYLNFEVEMLEKILDLTIEDESIILVYEYFD